MSAKSLNHYITELLTDDAALRKFLADPTNAEFEHGITKAERAVLRRILASLSNKSVNGYSIQRDLSSYRRSLRLLQNVLHKSVADHQASFTEVESGQSNGVLNPTVFIYITGDPNQPGAPYTNPALAYTNYLTLGQTGTFNTIGDAMLFSPPASPSINDTCTTSLGNVSDKNGYTGSLSYKAIYLAGASGNDWFVLSYTLSGFANNINGTYELPYAGAANRDPFWYFSLNGQAISPNSSQGYYFKTAGVTQGEGSTGFASFPLSSSDTKIVWQPIAPDQAYGFGACFKLPNNVVKLGESQPQVPAVNPGQLFYRNVVSNVTVLNTASILISSNTEGDGELFTDDVASVTFTDPVTGAVIYTYTHDFSNNCSGRVNKISPVNVQPYISAYVGKLINITTEYRDKCGGKTSSLGYYLVFK